MNKFCLLFFVVMTGGNVFAQGMSAEMDKEPVQWTQNIDTKTEWGKWFKDVIKPYWHKIREANKILMLSSFQSAKEVNLSPEASFKAQMVPLVNYCKALQNIVPPTELKIYHSELIEICEKESASGSSQEFKQVAKFTDNLSAEANQEIVQVFTKHNMPQKIIDQLTK